MTEKDITQKRNNMNKKNLAMLSAAALLWSSCSTVQMGTADPDAVFVGAAIGGQVGNALGGAIGDSNHGWHGAYRGSAIGTIVGTLAGAAIGGAISSSRQREAQAAHTATPRSEVEHGWNAAIDALRICRVRFIDDSRDHALSPEESSKVIFEIMNEDDHTARNVVPVVSETTGIKHVYISSSVMVEQIAPGEGVKYTATVSTSKRLKKGQLNLRIAIADEYGREYDWQEFTIDTKK